MELKKKLSLSGTFFGAVMVLSGCANGWNVDKMNESAAVGNPFTQALYAEYKEFVQSEVEWVDWKDADYFAVKATSAAEGVEVMPEDPAEWGIVGDDLVKMQNYRQELVRLLDIRGRAKRAALGAKAQVAFDCLVEQSANDENHQDVDKKKCRDTLTAALTDLKLPKQKTHTVHFNFGSSALTKETKATLKAAAEAAKRYDEAYIYLEGHADTVSTDAYNKTLSAKRAANARAYLVQLGIAGDRIRTEAYGEEQLAVETGDNVREAQNRRVVITFTDKK